MVIDPTFDLVITNGLIVSGPDILPRNVSIGVKNGIIETITTAKISGKKEIDAKGGYIMPGGIDSHVHLDQPNAFTSDTFETGTMSAVAGGTTTIIGFAVQPKAPIDPIDGDVRKVVKDYHEKAIKKSYCDYGFHLILSNPTKEVLEDQLPDLVKNEGITSVKIYTTYPRYILKDDEVLSVMLACRKLGMTTMIHAENSDIIDFLTKKLVEKGMGDPFYHSVARNELAEDEASYRVIKLAQVIDTPILLVHMSAKEALESVRRAQARTLPVFSETCPQYLFLTADNMKGCHDHPNEITDKEDKFEGAKFVCSPPLRRDQKALDGVWESIENGTVTIYSSDHSASIYDHPRGKKAGLINGIPHFPSIPNGLPGIETRMPLLFTRGVETGRISPNRFVEICSTNAAKLYGLEGRKGSIAVGYDADFVIWYPQGGMKPFTLTNSILHHRGDYTPYDGMEFKNWPRYTILRGTIIWDRDVCTETSIGTVVGKSSFGKYLSRGTSMLLGPKAKLNMLYK